MSVRLHGSGIARGFSAAADSYDHWAVPQRLAAQRLITLLPSSTAPRSVLDVGCGTGTLLRLLHERFPSAALVGADVAPGMIEVCRQQCKDLPSVSLMVADVEQLSAQTHFDLIASSFCLQWLRHRTQTIARLGQLLCRGGHFAAAVPVEGSLPELLESYRSTIGTPMSGLDFELPESYLRALEQGGMRVLSRDVEPVRLWLENGMEVLRYFQSTGTTFRHQPDYQPCSAAQTRRIARHYDEAFSDSAGRVPVTYRVLYLVAERT